MQSLNSLGLYSTIPCPNTEGIKAYEQEWLGSLSLSPTLGDQFALFPHDHACDLHLSLTEIKSHWFSVV